MRHRLIRLLLVVAAASLSAGCVVGLGPTPADSRPGSPPTVPPGAEALRTVPMEVLQSGDSTIAFVQVRIQGQGPYLFALDTGASNTVVDAQIADQLGLERTGRRQQVTGVVGQQVVEMARVDQWQLGDVQLEPGDVAVLDLPDAEQGRGVQGLIGSDVLSRFDYVVVDYDDRRLGLPPA